MPNVPINGVDLYYECHGEGPPLMLVAGLASDSQSWLPVVEPLSRHHRLILPDNRGVGRTRPQEAETGIGRIADDCMALVDHLGLPAIALLGHSMGGIVAMDCAIRYPERVSALILAATSAVNSARNNALFQDLVTHLKAGMPPELWFRNLFYWLFSRRLFEDPEALAAALQFAVDYPYPQGLAAFENQIEAIAAFRGETRLARIAQRTLILCGKEDLLFPPEESLQALQAIPRASVAVIEGAAHALHMENPGAFTERVLQFLHEG